jgi:beta-galactosidase
MRHKFTRRDFLGTATLVGAAAAIGPADLWGGKGAGKGSLTNTPRKSSFDDGWKFIKGDVPDAKTLSFADPGWATLNLPHDWSIEGPYSETEPSGPSGYLPTGIGWYRKTFDLPRSMANRRVLLQFDGVYQCSEVWINGESLGFRPYGFSTFFYDLRPHLRFGHEPNVIAVRVDNSHQPNLRWYSGSGIYRHTWLIQTGLIYIDQWGTIVRTPEVTAESASVEVSTRVRNESGKSSACTLKTEVIDQNGTVVQSRDTTSDIPAGGEFFFVQKMDVSQPKLWSSVTPHLYSARQTLSVQSAQADAVITPFGIRAIKFDVDKGFFLNGEHMKINGMCVHGEGGAVGAAVPIRIWQRRLQALKEMGCNAIRVSHNPPAEEFLDLCDSLGLLVMDEAFDEWREPKAPAYGYHRYFDQWATRDLTDMIARDRNHPSIVIWSAGNEVPDQVVLRGPQTLHDLMSIIRAGDPTRPITVACDRIASDPRSASPAFLEELDIVGYNYVDRWRDRREKFYSVDRQQYPQRRFIGTESPTLRGARGEYGLDSNKESPYPIDLSNVRIEVEQLQKFVQTYDYVIGDFSWTGIDYLGEAHWPFKSSSAGIFDTCGFPKDSYYFYKSLWTKTPVLHLFPHWNWAGREGQVIPVLCFTNCDSVELFLNGKSLGVKGYEFPRLGMEGEYGHYPARAMVLQTTADLHLSWDVPYEPGTMKAIGKKDGQVIQTVELSTTGKPAAVRLTADKMLIDTGWEDLSHVTVEIVDQQGLVVPNANNEVVFEVEGPGRLLGLDNGMPDSHESYKGNRRSVFSGMALALIQSNGNPGEIRLHASSESLSRASISISASDRLRQAS